MNSLWDDFLALFQSEETLVNKYGPRCKHCERHMMRYPWCRCHLIFGEDGQFPTDGRRQENG